MTGFDSKRKAAQGKLEQWDMPSEAFNEWWDSDYDDSTNPYEKDTFAYWAWAGWQAALAQPAQEPYGYVSIGDHPVFQKETPEIGRWETVYTTPPAAQPERKPLTDGQVSKIYAAWDEKAGASFADFARAIEAAHGIKEKNNGT